MTSSRHALHLRVLTHLYFLYFTNPSISYPPSDPNLLLTSVSVRRIKKLADRMKTESLGGLCTKPMRQERRETYSDMVRLASLNPTLRTGLK